MSLSRKSGFLLAACLAFGLSGCETSDLIDSVQAKVQDFNPFGVTKTPLKGERREVFPGGVPGVEQGIPPDLMKGHQTIPDPNAPPDVALSAPEPEKPAEAEKPKPKPKRHAAHPKREPRPAAKRKPAPAQPAAAENAPQQSAPQAAWPAPPAANQAPQWPAPSSQPAPTVWPDPPKPGQFTR
ncbi:MAG: hypothetical protein AB7O60_11760 [Variibacter sp.]